ncbi:MAG TPA: metalloregulator ArsR/SmtB family transcription factor [Coriobacteriia bacterium]
MSAMTGCGCDAPLDPCACAVTPAGEEDEALALDAVFKALASEPRRALLRIVAANTSAEGDCCPAEACACALSDALGLAPSTISHHMSALVGAGLVTATKRGLWVYYRLERDALARVAAELTAL